jgi:hypothetical protein
VRMCCATLVVSLVWRGILTTHGRGGRLAEVQARAALANPFDGHRDSSLTVMGFDAGVSACQVSPRLLDRVLEYLKGRRQPRRLEWRSINRGGSRFCDVNSGQKVGKPQGSTSMTYASAPNIQNSTLVCRFTLCRTILDT